MKYERKNALIASIVSRHSRQLIKFFASRLPDAGEARDLSQEVYLRLLRLERPDFIRCPEAYVFAIAANVAREHALKRSRRPLHIALEDVPVDDLSLDSDALIALSPEDTAERNCRIQRLEAALQQLSPKARAALIWHRRDGQTYGEIGERLGVSTNMVKKYLSQALAHCREHLAAAETKRMEQ